MQLSSWIPKARIVIQFAALTKADFLGFGIPAVAQDILISVGVKSPSSEQLENYAAILPTQGAELQVVKASFPTPAEDELVIRNRAVAVNPVDWKIQTTGGVDFNLTYPLVLGEDVAGDIVQLGQKLKDRFHIGQRVISYALGLSSGTSYGGFQIYPLLKGSVVAAIPDNLSFEEGVVLPLSISTAAAGLFSKDALALDYPTLNPQHSTSLQSKALALLVWGGSSSVGSSVIQLASAAGYSVITTSSPSNFEYCKRLGAAHVLDYHEPNILEDLASLLKSIPVVGAYDAIGSSSTANQCVSVLHAIGGGKVVTVGSPPTDAFDDVSFVRISASNIITDEPEISEKIWAEYVPAALKAESLSAKPDPVVVGKGLETVQGGVDKQKEGVSAQKVVILL